MKIILSVQPTSQYFRLGLSKSDSKKYFSHLESVKFVLSDSKELLCNVACGTSKKKAFDFNSSELSKWIVDNGFHYYPKRKPTKLVFDFDNKKRKTLKYVGVKTSP